MTSVYDIILNRCALLIPLPPEHSAEAVSLVSSAHEQQPAGLYPVTLRRRSCPVSLAIPLCLFASPRRSPQLALLYQIALLPSPPRLHRCNELEFERTSGPRARREREDEIEEARARALEYGSLSLSLAQHSRRLAPEVARMSMVQVSEERSIWQGSREGEEGVGGRGGRGGRSGTSTRCTGPPSHRRHLDHARHAPPQAVLAVFQLRKQVQAMPAMLPTGTRYLRDEGV